jgi:hypothetical protein
LLTCCHCLVRRIIICIRNIVQAIVFPPFYCVDNCHDNHLYKQAEPNDIFLNNYCLGPLGLKKSAGKQPMVYRFFPETFKLHLPYFYAELLLKNINLGKSYK